MQISPSPPVFFLSGAACNHSPKRPNSPLSVTFQLVFSTMWKLPDADPLLAVKHIQMYSIMPLCCNLIMPARCTKEPKGRCIPGEDLQRKWTKYEYIYRLKTFLRMHLNFFSIYLYSHFSLPVDCVSVFVRTPSVSLNHLIFCLQGLPGSRYTRMVVCNGLFGIVGARNRGTGI